MIQAYRSARRDKRQRHFKPRIEPNDRSFDSDVVRFDCSARRCGAGLLPRL